MSIFADIPFFGALILALFGILFCAFGLKAIHEKRVFRTRGTRHVATVVSKQAFGHGEGRKSFQLTFEFTDAQGITQRKRSDGGSSAYDFDVGSEHAILHLPGVDTVVLADLKEAEIFSYGLFFGGVVCLVFGLGGIAF